MDGKINSKSAGETLGEAERTRFADLLAAIAARQDRPAYSELFAYYAPRVKSYLLRLGADGPLAEEITQDVMVTVWRKAALFDRTQASVSTWIFRIARNRRIDLFRRAAEQDGRHISSWARSRLERAAKQELTPSGRNRPAT